jgi:hypothetical protein
MKGSEMQTPIEAEGLLADPPTTLPSAANEEFSANGPRSTGWDPYEVWRTRIRVVQHNVESGVGLG